MYQGEIKLEFDTSRHTYRVVNNGRRFKVPSVTTVCSVVAKPALVPWAVNATVELCKGAIAPGTEYAESYLEAVWKAAKDANRTIKQEAANRGKEKHRAIEEVIKTSQGSTEGLGELEQLGAKRVLSVERRIYSRRHRYSGTFDCLVVIGSGPNSYLVLIDWKTSKSIYPEFRLQTAAYVKAYEEEFPDQLIEGRYLVRIAEDGSIEPHYFPRSTLRLDFSAFLGALSLYRRIQQIERKK